MALLGLIGIIDPVRPEAREAIARCRKPEMVAEAAHAILCRPMAECSGNFFVDEEVLAAEGVTDFSSYAVAPGSDLLPDFFL